MTDACPIFLLFPGQGTEHVGMSASWAESPAWLATIQEAEACSGFPLKMWMACGPEEDLKAPTMPLALLWLIPLAYIVPIVRLGCL